MKKYILIRKNETGEYIICYPHTLMPDHISNTPAQDFEICWQYALDAGLVETGTKDKYRFEYVNPNDSLYNETNNQFDNKTSKNTLETLTFQESRHRPEQKTKE